MADSPNAAHCSLNKSVAISGSVTIPDSPRTAVVMADARKRKVDVVVVFRFDRSSAGLDFVAPEITSR
jgi:hypothetical protein